MSLPSLLSSVLRTRLEPTARKRVRIEATDDLPTVTADPERIERVVANLLGNALKYSPPGKEVVVHVATDREGVVVSVVDRGVGILAEDLPRVFDRFYRAAKGRTTEGLGLGLYIARLVVEAHGGRIWVESPGPDQGSRFSFTLPLD